MNLLKIDNLHASIGEDKILNGFSLEINAGETHAIMGPNGSGKSTLSYVLSGRKDYDVNEGSIHLKNKNPFSEPRCYITQEQETGIGFLCTICGGSVMSD